MGAALTVWDEGQEGAQSWTCRLAPLGSHPCSGAGVGEHHQGAQGMETALGAQVSVGKCHQRWT